jgi:hypothetical protein
VADHLTALRRLSDVCTALREKHHAEMRAIGNRIPVGGDHMDLFFRIEGLDGAVRALRAGRPTDQAIEEGKWASAEAVKRWNARREWQVHRWDSTAHDFIERTVRMYFMSEPMKPDEPAPAAKGAPPGPPELYLRYRPKTFDEVRGQPRAVASLKQLLNDHVVPHAILLTGSSGTGKTTLARILARALGCHKFDFFEVNAAEARGIDTVRDIQARMTLAPVGKCRVYLTDEAHRLTPDAQGALLKTLEDTPRHVYFMLATTDPQKLLKTIRTRCTQIHVEDFSAGDLKDLVADVAAKENCTLAQPVVDAIAEAAGGSAREALKLLHQVIGLPPGEQLDAVVHSDERRQAIDLCRLMMNPKAKWAQVAALLKEIEGDAETLRRSVLGYSRTVLLGGGPLAPLAATVMGAFECHFYDSGLSGLALAAWRVHGEVAGK